MSSKGFASRRTRSAAFPVSSVPRRFDLPKNAAGFRVAACRASRGVKPASTSNANSSCRFVPRRWWHQLLHAQTGVTLRLALINYPGIVITSVPYQVSGEGDTDEE